MGDQAPIRENEVFFSDGSSQKIDSIETSILTYMSGIKFEIDCRQMNETKYRSLNQKNPEDFLNMFLDFANKHQ